MYFVMRLCSKLERKSATFIVSITFWRELSASWSVGELAVGELVCRRVVHKPPGLLQLTALRNDRQSVPAMVEMVMTTGAILSPPTKQHPINADFVLRPQRRLTGIFIFFHGKGIGTWYNAT